MDKNTWDAFVLKTAPMALFQSWDWGEVEKKLGHKIWRLTWPGGIAQVVKVPARRGTFLHIRHGPVGTIQLDDVIELAKKERAWFIRISPQVQKIDYPGFVPAPIHAMDAEVCRVLDLDKREDELLLGMRKSTRYEIKHASATVKKSRDIEKFIRLYDATAKRHNFVEHKGIREEFDSLDCDLFLASHGGHLAAAAIIVYSGDQAIYHHGASVPNKFGASYLVQWEAIREAKRRGMKVYNFWGIAPDNAPNHPWQGLTAFKTGFGGREVRFIHAMDLPVSPWYVIPKTIEGIRKKIKGY
ncbi:hypothetical protein A2363_04960 [Candidatus Gottesmanbacteria bacterium RIFOXYB1_FULL_47_11]|uniref:BioF2-like acetyltransferase domain-containing protein n=1 Tax=Candidatus Gottesmanbacteria bacterium RIFOXYB1_FULL_47_11 TaxID=1798401 RepID=A0A1F6BC57_9BACT|nr:MAG: hypothetical protein A2363_04960 [Candidatus Gottesmanbacteria bacterium RIFOXYB1_FULL_47_11]